MSYSRPMYPVSNRDCPDGCGAYVGEGCRNTHDAPPERNYVIVNCPGGGLDSVHPLCMERAYGMGYRYEVLTRSPAYELRNRDCPACGTPLSRLYMPPA